MSGEGITHLIFFIGAIVIAVGVIGAVTTNVAILRGRSSVMMTSYVPMPAEPVFYLGLILFAVGALIGCGVFFPVFFT